MRDEVRRLFEGRNFVHVATVTTDGAPHSVAVWAGVEDDLVVFFSQSTSQQAKNLERDGRVALSVTDAENPHRSAHVRGRVVEERHGAAALEIVDRLAVKYTGEPVPLRGPDTVLFFVDPERDGYVELPFRHRP